MKRISSCVVVLILALAIANVASAQQQDSPNSSPNSLVQLLKAKGVITPEEAATLAGAGSPSETERLLAELLLSKGVITEDDYRQAFRAEPVAFGAHTLTGARLLPAVARVAASAPVEPRPVVAPPKPEAPPMIPAVAPLRVLPITIPKKEGLLPDIKLGTGVRLRPYGFFKASVAQQSVSHGGATFGSNDFPQGPLLLADTGPDGDPQFHVKDRAFRTGVDFEWPDVAKNLTLTGKLEFDFEGDFTDVNNRNISANRSNQPSLRLAWVRLDTKLGSIPWFAQFGQDWSIFGSSTLMDLFETTGFGFAQGNLYERMPMFRTGAQFGKGDLKFQPEFALALSSFGEPGLSVDQRLRFGSRVGPESNRPEFETRFVFQFPLSHAPGVLPAQIIFSGDHATRSEIVDASSLSVSGLDPRIRAAFPQGVRRSSDRNAWSAEVQLPTPYVTVVGKYYRGGDLRYYFMGQFNDVFTDLGGAVPIPGPMGSATSFSGRSIPFGILGNQIVAANLEPVTGQGGFMQLGLPLSRIFNAAPDGRNAGWTLYLTYGIDSAVAKDAVRGNGLLRTDHGSVQVRYKLNRWVSFIDEETYLDTRTAGSIQRPFRGVPAHTAHAWRSEFGPLFTF